MAANGADYGYPTFHYFWIGAVPAMLFLGVVMMPFYYGSKVRSVPEFMYRRFGSGAHLVNAISFAVAQLLIAGINLYLLASLVEILLGWPLWVSLVVAAAIVLTYTALGGLSAAIYNEVLQFFVIVAALTPLTIVALNKIGGWDGFTDRVANGPGGSEQLSSWPGTALSGFDSPVLSVIGIVFGLGFVLSFGYWTTNFVEVQRAMASSSMSAAQRSPIIGAFPKMFVPFIVVLPGMLAAVMVQELIDTKAGNGNAEYNQAILYLMRDLLPNGMLGLAIAGLLASFMAGMAANISAFNTVFSYDLWQTYLVKERSDDYYTGVGRVATFAATVVAIGTATFAASYSNIMDYLQTLFGFFNAPLFATFILAMFWKRMTPTAGWLGLVLGTAAAVTVWVLSEDVTGVIGIGGQGGAFVAAGAAFVVDVVASILISLVTRPKAEKELKGLVWSLTPREDFRDERDVDLAWYQQPTKLAGVGLACVIVLNIMFW
jgi:SSS family solute:Na+ symporter